MQNQNNKPIIAEPIISNTIPAKWEKPELFKTNFENTESGGPADIVENAFYHVYSNMDT